MLLDAIKKTPLLRPNALPRSANIGIICFKSAFSDINDMLLRNCQAIFIIDADEKQIIELNDYIFQKRNKKIPVLHFSNISSRIELTFVFFHNNDQYHPIGHCYKYMRNAGFESFYTFIPIPHVDHSLVVGTVSSVYHPEFYKNYEEYLNQVYTMLNDEESKLILAARIRAIQSGTIGYIKVSTYDEYYHPFVAPELCDIILDGGVSEYINSQIHFVKTIGATGKYYGFEPDPVGFCKAYEGMNRLAPYTNYELIPFGLWHKQGKLRFEMLGLGTRSTDLNNASTIECDVLSIDEFVKCRNMNQVDFIKLDVEGAELNVIKGAIKTITKFRPKLAISVYHKLQDIYFIPLFLKDICPDYEFYLGQHHSSLFETILYAKSKY